MHCRQLLVRPKSRHEATERRSAAIQEIGRIKHEIVQLESMRRALGQEVDYMNMFLKGRKNADD